MPALTDHDPAGGVPAACGEPGEIQATALLADWFARLLLAPLDAAGIARHQGAEARAFMRGLGEELACEASAGALLDALGSGPAEVIEARMSRHYVLLFEGVSGPKSISLYESSHCGQGPGLFNQPFVEMQEILRALDLRVDGPCREPPDHLAVELAALAKALRLGRLQVADRLVSRLLGWVPSVAAAVAHSPHGGLYSPLFALLDAFLSAAASSSWPAAGQAPHAYQEAHHAHG